MPGTQNLAEARFQDELTIPQQKISISWTAHSQSPRCTGGQTGWLSTEATGRRGGHPETSLRRGLSSPWPWEMSTVYFCWAQETHHCGYLKEQKSAPIFLLSWKCNAFSYSSPTVPRTFERDFTEYWINYLPKYQVFDLQITRQVHKLL